MAIPGLVWNVVAHGIYQLSPRAWRNRIEEIQTAL